MTRKKKGVLPLLLHVRMDAPARETVCLTIPAYENCHISSEEHILLMIPTAYTISEKDQRQTFLRRCLPRHARTFFDELQSHQLDEAKERFPMFVVCLEVKTQETKVISH